MASEALYDTSVWVALFEGSEVSDVDRALGGLPPELDAVVSPVGLAEMASLEVRGRLKGSPIEAMIATARVEEITPEDAIAAGKLHGRMRQEGHEKVSLVDCLAYATARRIGALFVTYDSDLAGQPGVKVLGAPKKRKKP